MPNMTPAGVRQMTSTPPGGSIHTRVPLPLSDVTYTCVLMNTHMLQRILLLWCPKHPLPERHRSPAGAGEPWRRAFEDFFGLEAAPTKGARAPALREISCVARTRKAAR